jgi:hypothetical protein
LGYSLGYRKLSFHDLFHENHFATGIGNGPFGQIKNGTDCPAKATAGTLINGFPPFFV